MGVIRLGYATRNLSLGASTNHALRLAGLSDPEKVRRTVRQNVEDLASIVRWNAARGLPLFRIGQSFVPFASHPSFPYDWRKVHGEEIEEVGALARSLGVGLSMHPGQYTNPSSPEPSVVERSLAELRYSARLLSTLGAENGVVVLHGGGVYGDRQRAAGRLVETLENEEVLRYLALENDERSWNVEELAPVCERLGVPLIVDSFHHAINPGGLSLSGALETALEGWKKKGSPMKVHLSSQDREKRPGAHSRRVNLQDARTLLTALGPGDADVMLEAKENDLAALELLEELRR